MTKNEMQELREWAAELQQSYETSGNNYMGALLAKLLAESAAEPSASPAQAFEHMRAVTGDALDGMDARNPSAPPYCHCASVHHPECAYYLWAKSQSNREAHR